MLLNVLRTIKTNTRSEGSGMLVWGNRADGASDGQVGSHQEGKI